MHLFKALYFAFKTQQPHCEPSSSLTENTGCLSTLLSTHSQHDSSPHSTVYTQIKRVILWETRGYSKSQIQSPARVNSREPLSRGGVHVSCITTQTNFSDVSSPSFFYEVVWTVKYSLYPAASPILGMMLLIVQYARHLALPTFIWYTQHRTEAWIPGYPEPWDPGAPVHQQMSSTPACLSFHIPRWRITTLL